MVNDQIILSVNINESSSDRVVLLFHLNACYTHDLRVFTKITPTRKYSTNIKSILNDQILYLKVI